VIDIGEVGKTCPRCGRLFVGNKCPFCGYEVLPEVVKRVKKDV